MTSTLPVISLQVPRPDRPRSLTDFSCNSMLRYVNKVYHLMDGLCSVKDSRAPNKSVPLENIMMAALGRHLLRMESTNRLFGAKLSKQSVRLHLCISPSLSTGEFVPVSHDTVDRFLAFNMTEGQMNDFLWDMARRSDRNHVFEQNAVDGVVAAILDGIRMGHFAQAKCPHCLSETHSNGETDYFHRIVVMSVPFANGGHQVIGYDFLLSRDPSDKDEGELTGGVRLLEDLHDEMPGKIQALLADALYDCSTIVNMCIRDNLWPVLRMRDERRLLYKQAEARLGNGEGNQTSFIGVLRKGGRYLVTATWADDFEMTGVDQPMRVIRFVETPCDAKGRPEERLNAKGEIEQSHVAYILTGTRKSKDGTPEYLPITTAWKLAHMRWDIEDNGFHTLATDFHAKHTFSHMAADVIFGFILLAFNIYQLYLFRFRRREFLGHKCTMKDFADKLMEDLMSQSVRIVFSELARSGTG